MTAPRYTVRVDWFTTANGRAGASLRMERVDYPHKSAKAALSRMGKLSKKMLVGKCGVAVSCVLPSGERVARNKLARIVDAGVKL